MDRYTIKLSFQQGRKLGIVIQNFYDDNGHRVDGAESSNRSSNIEHLIIEEDAGINLIDQNPLVTTRSLHSEFAAEANPVASIEQRKMKTKVCFMPQSSVFTVAQELLGTATTKQEEEGGNINNDKISPQTNNLSNNLDRLIKSRPIDHLNDEMLKFVLTGTIKAGDIVEKIEYTRQHRPLLQQKKLKIVVPRQVKGQRRCEAYCRSDHYTAIYCTNQCATAIIDIIRQPQNYPMYITFLRPSSNVLVSSPPRKRLKTDESINNLSLNTNSQNHDVISLLDSSDDDSCEKSNDNSLQINDDKTTIDADDTTINTEGATLTTNSLSKLPLLSKVVPPDPPQLPFNNDPVKEDEFVLTPYGPGKIKSSRIERNAIDNDDHSFGSIFRPTIIYTIDLHFGICHVPANQVTPIAGTSFTEKTVLTYQRAPLTEHDILRLRPMTYLNDSIVNFYLKIMKDQYDQYNNVRPLTNRGWDDLDGEGIHIFPSFCYTRIKNTIGSDTRNSKAMRTKIWNDLSSWTRGTDIFKKKFLIFPINYDLHWSCVFVCHPGRLVRRYANELQRNNVQIDISSEESNEYHGVRNPLTQWQCDFCKIARFDTFNEASEHEKVCEENVDRCMIHFDSGKHFKLHNTSLITSVIRNYLSAVAEYASTHRPLSFTTKNMPGFAASVPQQDNTKDCGVYTLENVERMLQGTHTIDFDFVKSKGTNNLFGEGTLIPGYDKHDIEQKRENILSLIQDLRRGHNNIVR